MVELPGIDSTVIVDVLINKPPRRRFLKVLANPSPLAKLLEIITVKNVLLLLNLQFKVKTEVLQK